MDREIKFRGKRIDNGEWVYGSYVDFGERCGKSQHEISCIGENRQEYYNVDIKTVGQYTGLKDKNGKEIYEGDIIKQDVFDDLYVVEFKNGKFVATKLSNYKDLCNVSCAIVIGNIHDNPKL